VFYIYAVLFVILLNFAGFMPSFVDPSRRAGPPTTAVIGHGLLALSWLLLFLVQAALVATNRTALHRRLGAIGPILAAAMIGAGCLAVVEWGRRGFDLSGDIARVAVAPGAPPLSREAFIAGLFAPVQAFGNFAVLTGFGLIYRRRPEVHKRLMLLGIASLVFTPMIHLSGYLIGHWPALHGPLNIIIPLVATSVLFAGAVHDRISIGRIHPVSLWAPLLLIAVTLSSSALIEQSAAWQTLALWIISR
jgi:hypothetical protein